SIEEESVNDFDILFDSFEFKEEDMKKSNKAGKEEERHVKVDGEKFKDSQISSSFWTFILRKFDANFGNFKRRF
ncbi:hypothetical protein QYM36_001828, partial [Artemia franciscana]